jgi:hypothetical protein
MQIDIYLVETLLPQCDCTASFSSRSLSSSSAQLPVRPLARSLLGFKTEYHLLLHCSFFRPGTSAAIVSQFLPPCVCNASFSLLFQLLSISPSMPSSGRCWRPRYYAICHYTEFWFDPEPALQLHPNSCHRAFVPHPLA